MLVPFANLSLQWDQIREEAMGEIADLFQQSAFSLGPWVESFEEKCAAYLGAPHAVGVNSGTSALHLALIAAGVGPGDKVIVPSLTFVGTLWGVLYCGATPVLCDVDENTGLMTADLVRRQFMCGAKAVIPVHLYGQPVEMDPILDLANAHGISVVEDVAQAFGAKYRDRKLGNFGQTGCYSFYPGKNLGAAGEAGLVVTHNPDIAARIRTLRNHAQKDRYLHTEMGFNYRMDGLQGLILSKKLVRLEDWTNERRKISDLYLEKLGKLPLILPVVANGDHVWHLFVVRTPERDALRDHLIDRGIETGLHYPHALHAQPCLEEYKFNKKDYPVAERWSNEGLSLPLFPGMTEAQLEHVVSSIADFFA